MDEAPREDSASAESSELERAVEGLVADLGSERAGELLDALPPAEAVQGVGPGTRLGEFRLVRELGSGGMGIVYEATQESVPGKRVAVKILPALRASPRQVERFRREIATIGRLDHPAVVPIVASGVEQGTLFYAMRFVEGVSLSRVVRELGLRGGPPDGTAAVRSLVGAPETDDGDSWEADYLRWVARVGLELAEALDHAHRNGVVHRDVKPGNAIVTPEGRTVLVDFGLAVGGGDETLTISGDFLGTLAYASPEQARGEEVDARTDVYGVGATLYELITLRRPHDATSRNELLRRIEREEPPTPGSWVPADLRTIVGCALARSPSARYPTAGALAHDLRQFLAGRPIQARPPGLAARVLQWVRAHPRTSVAVAAVLLAVAGLRAGDHMAASSRLRAGRAALARAQQQEQALEDALGTWHARLDAEREPDLAPEPGVHDQLRASIADARARFEASLDQAEDLLYGTFEHVAGHRPAHRALAELQAARLRRCLAEFGDVLDAPALTGIERRLAEHDDAGRFAALLGRTGSMRLDSSPPGATVEVWRNVEGRTAPAVHTSGATPLVLADLEEGSWMARVSAEGFATVLLPFLVRRSASEDLADPGVPRPPLEAGVRMLPARDVEPGWVHVPGGWTLVADDPPRWERVGSYLIQEDEVTYEILVGWINAFLGLDGSESQSRWDAREPTNKPRYADQPDKLHVTWVAGGGGRGGLWMLEDEARPDWPARGLRYTEIEDVIGYLGLLREVRPSGWIEGLPTRHEWLRAARGADGRTYPWGRAFTFEHCANYRSGGDADHEPEPYPIRSFPRDVSPFGVHDMAGSMREALGETLGPVRGEFAVGGGSYRQAREHELRVTSIAGVINEPRADLGFRLVRRPEPAWHAEPDAEPTPFFDDFERPDSAHVGNGWVELVGVPLATAHNPNQPETCRIEEGRLRLEGGVDDYSTSCTALRRIHVDPAAFEIRAVMSASHDPGQAPGNRGFGLELRHGYRFDSGPGIVLRATLAEPRTVTLAVGSERVESGPLELEGPLAFEVRALGGELEGRVWSAAGPRPERPTVALVPDDPPRRTRFLGIVAAHYVGVRLAVDEVGVRSLR